MNLRNAGGLGVCVMTLLSMTTARGEMWYWNVGARGANQKGDPSVLSNWSLSFDSTKKCPVAGDCPTKASTTSTDVMAHRDFYFDMNGKTVYFQNFLMETKTDLYGGGGYGQKGDCWRYTNGTISVNNISVRLRTGYPMTIDKGAKLIVRGYFVPGDGMGGDGICSVNVERGGTLEAADMRFYNGQLNVKEGATATLAKAAIHAGAQPTSSITNWGTLTLSKGIQHTGGTAAAKLSVCQEGGVMVLGGPVSRNGKDSQLEFAVKGGRLRATANVSFNVNSATVAANVCLTNEVVSGRLLDMTGFTFGSGVKIVKTSPGDITFGDNWPAELRIENGSLRFDDAGVVCPIAPVLAGGGIYLLAKNTRIDSISFESADVTCRMDVESVDDGDMILLSTDEDVLDWACNDLNEWFADEYPECAVEKVDGGLKFHMNRYYWLVGDFGANEKGDASNLSNWSVKFDSSTRLPVEDAHPTALPQSTTAAICAYRDFFLDMNGASLTFGAMSQQYDRTNPYTGSSGYYGTDGYSWQFTNGTISVSEMYCALHNEGTTENDRFTVWNGATYICRGDFVPGYGMGPNGVMPINVEYGGRLEVENFLPYNGRLNVKAGGEAVLTNVDVNYFSTQKTIWIKNWGSTVLANGIAFATGSSGAMAVYQEGGVMTLGGPVARNGKKTGLDFVFNGGTMKATADVSFDVSSATTAANLALTTEVAAAGATMDLSSFTFADGSGIVKTGAGILDFGSAWPTAVKVEEGLLRLGTANGECGAELTVAEGGGLVFAAKNVRIDTATLDANATYKIDTASVSAGETFLLSTSDDVLAKVMAGVNAWCAQEGLQISVERSGNALIVGGSHNFDATSGKSLDDPAGWGEASVPPSSAIVNVRGTGIVGYSADSPAFAAIRVCDGATLKATGGTSEEPVQLPRIILCGSARLLADEDAFVKLHENLESYVEGNVLPVFEVSTNAWVYASGVETAGTVAGSLRNDIRFANVDMRLYGTLETPVAYKWCLAGDPEWTQRYVHLWLGTADAGDTAKFAFTGDGANIRLMNYSWNYGFAALHIACPEDGGRVVAESPLRFLNCTFDPYNPTGVRSMNALFVGIGNPTDEPIAIEADNTVFDATDDSKIGGDTDFTLRNGSAFKSTEYTNSQLVQLEVTDLARISLVDTEFIYRRSHATKLDSDIVLSSSGQDGEVLNCRRSSLSVWRVKGADGARKGTFADTVWKLGKFIQDGGGSQAYTAYPTSVFNGLTEACIPSGTTFTLLGTNYTWDTTSKTWDRWIDFSAAAAITGGGDLVVDSVATDNSMTATVLGGNNTCTGMAMARHGVNARLRFANGSNWAGTVIANGCIELYATNSVGEATAAEVSFGTLQLDADFPIRVWREGTALAGDRVNLASPVTGTGALVVECQGEFKPDSGETVILGLYPAGAALPKIRPGNWSVSSAATADPDYVLLTLKYSKIGTIMYMR